MKTKLSSMFMKFRINSALILIITLSCSGNRESFGLEDDKIYLIIPVSQSCGSCTKTALKFVEDHDTLISNSENFKVVFTAIPASPFDITHQKIIQFKDRVNFQLDTTDYYLNEDIVGIYPVILEQNKGKISHFEVDPGHVDAVLRELKDIL